MSVVADQPLSQPAEFYVEFVGGTATEGLDYHAIRGHIQMQAGQQEISFPVLHVLDDNLPEPAESVQLRLVVVSGAALGEPSTLTVTIEDNDLHAAPDPEPASAVLTPDALLPYQQQVGGSMYQVSLASGALTLQHTLVSNSQPLQLLYNSATADPRPIFVVRHTLQSPASLVHAQLHLAGNPEPEVFINTTGLAAGETILFSLQADGRVLPTGRYDYTITVIEEGGSPEVIATTYAGQITLVSARQTPLSSGWTLSDGLALVPLAEGVALVRPDGTTAWFAWDNSTGSYITPPGLFARLERHADQTYTLRAHHGTSWNFDASGRLTSIIDRNGNTTRYSYDASGHLVSRTDPLGLTTTFSYTNDRLTSISDPSGRTTILQYDLQGRLSRIIDPDPDGNGSEQAPEVQFTYDDANRLVSYTDARGSVTRFSYGTAGRVFRIERPDGWYEEIQAAQSSLLLSPQNASRAEPAPANVGNHPWAIYLDANGNTWRTELDNLGFGLASSQSDPLGNATQIVRNADGLPIQVIDPLGRTTSYSYDQEGNLVAYVLPNGAVYQYSYNAFGQATQIIAPDPDDSGPRAASVTNLVYDDRGNLIELILPDDDLDPQNNPRWSYTYTTDGYKGLLLSQTNPRGYTTYYVYDPLARLSETVYPDDDTDPSNNPRMSFTYDAYGNLASHTDERGYTWHYVYDALDRLVQVLQPEGNATYYRYDAAGNLVAEIDEFGNATTYNYDAMNRLVAVTGPDPDGDGPELPAVTRYSYDGAGNLTSVVDPVGRTTTFAYDSAGRLIRRTIGQDHTYEYEYDSAGQLIRVLFPVPDLNFPSVRLIVEYAYNLLGQLVQVANNLGHMVRYTYNRIGELEGYG